MFASFASKTNLALDDWDGGALQPHAAPSALQAPADVTHSALDGGGRRDHTAALDGDVAGRALYLRR